jgi:hypothetical protein
MQIIDYVITWIIHQQLWGYKVEEKLYLGVLQQKRLNTTGLDYSSFTYPPRVDDNDREADFETRLYAVY